MTQRPEADDRGDDAVRKSGGGGSTARRAGRLGPLAHGAAAVVLVVTVVAVAYGASAPSLAVAEFAPAARESLEAPPTTSNAGAVAADRRGGRATTTTTAPTETSASSTPDAEAPAPTTRIGRSRQCFGDPPRQTEDPMSPPCMATMFEGDNGGDTSRGVSATEIRIGVPVPDTSTRFTIPINALFEFINSGFEFYGRRLVPVYVAGSAGSAVGARTNAAELAAKNVFGAITGAQEWYMSQAALSAELGRQGVVTVVRGATGWWTDRTLYDALHPYVWSVFPSSEDVQRNLGDLMCTGLAGKQASHAGDTGFRSLPRRFAILASGKEVPPSVTVLADALSACTGVEPLRVALTELMPAADRRAGMERLRSGGATTLLCVCEANGIWNATSDAKALGFAPEWVMTSTYGATGYDEAIVQDFRAGGMPAPLRLDAGPRLLPLQTRPWFHAIENALLVPGADQYAIVSMGEFVYSQLLVMASGIQGAGPALTPDAFAQALLSMRFPNPGAGAAPYWQPSAGFGPGDHSFYDDYLVAWWSDTAPALDGPISNKPQGSWCYLQQGRRFQPGSYPSDADSSLFNPAIPCR